MKKYGLVAALSVIMLLSGCNSSITSNQETISRLESEIAALKEENSILKDNFESNASDISDGIPENMETAVPTTNATSETVETERQVDIPENTNFRNTVWGMTRDEVMAVETLELDYDDNGNLFYKTTTIAGLTATPLYLFDDNGKLWRGVYLFNLKHSNENLYIEDFYKVADRLDDKYGNGDYQYYWNDDLYEDDINKWGFAISIGDLEIEAAWEMEETTIWLNVSGDNYDIQLNLYYDSETYERVKDSSMSGL